MEASDTAQNEDIFLAFLQEYSSSKESSDVQMSSNLYYLFGCRTYIAYLL